VRIATLALFVAALQTDARTIETVDDIDMVAMGLDPDHLDKENTKIIEGVPVLNYGMTYGGGMNPSLLELAESKEWIVDFPDGTEDKDIDRFCAPSNVQGNGACDRKGHISGGGVAVVMFHGSEDELKGTLNGFTPQPSFIESDQPVSIVPEIDEKDDLTLEEETALLQIDKAGSTVPWGVDRIDDAKGLDSDYTLKTGSRQGQGAHVYVADTGVYVSHSDFEGRAVPGIEALSSRVKVCSTSDKNCAADRHGHGTHCAGTIGGKKYGVAKKTSLYGVKVLSDSGRGSFAGIIASVDWVASSGKKPAVWSASLGGRGKMQSIEVAFAKALKSNVVISVAAGNSRGDACGYTPAFAKSAITVAAANKPSSSGSDARAGFSNYGSCIDVFAPGVCMLSASHRSPTRSATMSGTSMACPHVSGAVALFLGDDSSLTAAAAVAHMKKKATPGTIRDARGSPNLMLYVGDGNGGGGPGNTPAPTPKPTQAPTAKPISGDLVCGFEDSTWCNGAFTQDKSDDIDWSRKSGRTPSSSTGPSGAQGGRYYAYIETSSPVKNNAKASLNSGSVDLKQGAEISMYYHMYGSRMGTLRVDLNDGGSVVNLLEKKNNQGNKWIKWTHDLSSYAGKTVSFSISATKGTYWRGDIAIDSLRLSSGKGQPPTNPPTSAPTAAPTNPPTSPPTNPPTAPPTNPPTAPPTNPPTSPPTNPPATQPPYDLKNEIEKLRKEFSGGLQRATSAFQTFESNANKRLSSLDGLLNQILKKIGAGGGGGGLTLNEDSEEGEAEMTESEEEDEGEEDEPEEDPEEPSTEEPEE